MFELTVGSHPRLAIKQIEHLKARNISFSLSFWCTVPLSATAAGTQRLFPGLLANTTSHRRKHLVTAWEQLCRVTGPLSPVGDRSVMVVHWYLFGSSR